MTDKLKTHGDLLNFLKVTRTVPISTRNKIPNFFGFSGTFRDSGALLKHENQGGQDSAQSEERIFRSSFDKPSLNTARQLLKDDQPLVKLTNETNTVSDAVR